MHHTFYPFIVMFNIVEHPRSKFPLYYGIYVILLYHYIIILAVNDFQQVSSIFLSLEVKSKSAACRVRESAKHKAFCPWLSHEGKHKALTLENPSKNIKCRLTNFTMSEVTVFVFVF